MGRLVKDIPQINTRYNHGMQNIIFEHITRRTLKQMGSSSKEHTGCRSGQIRTAHGGYNSHSVMSGGPVSVTFPNQFQLGNPENAPGKFEIHFDDLLVESIQRKSFR